MANSIVVALKRYLFLDTEHLRTPNANVWKLSVLRIIVAVGVTLTSTIVLHSSYTAISQGLYYILYLTVGFSLLLYCALGLKEKHLKLASAVLVMTIVLAGICILFFTTDLASARYGLLFFFTLPIILRLFYGNKVAIAGMLFNFIPFAILLKNKPLAPFLGIDVTLPDTHTYLSSLIFLFFNFCLPFAVIRVMASLEGQAKVNLEQSHKLGKLVNQYQEIFNNGGSPSFFCDQQGRILQANKSARKLIHQFAAPCEYIHELFELQAPLAQGVRQTTHLVGQENAIFEIQPASLYHHRKQLIHCFDISKIQAKSRKLAAFQRRHYEQHYIDALTGFKNHHCWNRCNLSTLPINSYVALIKLTNLRDINLQYGYSQGDSLLAHCAAIMQATLPSGATLYRFPGAKFLVTCANTESTRLDIIPWLKSHLPLKGSMALDNKALILPLSWQAGFTLIGKKPRAEFITECCSIALSQANSENPYVAFNSNVVKLIREGSQHKDKIKALLDSDSLDLWLQPQVSSSNTIIGFEALARLRDGEHTLQPHQFLPLIEENGWHILLTQKVLDKAISLVSHWPDSMPMVPISINLSGPELLSDLFYEKLLRHYSENKLLRQRLKLELTETSVLASHQETKRRLTSLADIGATIIIDDFGTGHASLSQLIDMSATVLKVDKEFIECIETSERHQKIVQITLDLAKSLDMQTIAEGVETQSQLILLKEMGFTLFQGYLFGKPAPMESWKGMEKALMVGSTA